MERENARLNAEVEQLRNEWSIAIDHLEDITNNTYWEINESGDLMWVGDDDLIDLAFNFAKKIRASLEVKP